MDSTLDYRKLRAYIRVASLNPLIIMAPEIEQLQEKVLLVFDAEGCQNVEVELKAAMYAGSQDPIILTNLGITFVSLRKIHLAEEAFRRALAIDIRYSDAWWNLANVLRELGKHAEADAAYQQASKLCNLTDPSISFERMLWETTRIIVRQDLP